MAAPDCFEIRGGSCPAAGKAHLILSVLGVLSIMSASTTWVWTAGMLAALAVSHHLILRKIRNDSHPVRIRIFGDGTACLVTAGQEVLARIEQKVETNALHAPRMSRAARRVGVGIRLLKCSKPDVVNLVRCHEIAGRSERFELAASFGVQGGRGRGVKQQPVLDADHGHARLEREPGEPQP